MILTVDSHPELDLGAFVTTFAQPLGELPSPDWLLDLLRHDTDAPVSRSEEIRVAVRDLLRHGGYKPTGRGKPASEYLVRAAEQGKLGSINAAVDCCNAVSLHSGLPISLVDLDLANAPFRVGLADPESRYIFNASGQEIRVGGLLCLHDTDGPCANAVKDAQRTKTHDGTKRTLSCVWGTNRLEGRAAEVTMWYRVILERLGARTENMELA
jgi:DNA/RNA-binding domain of Phe-tRNA-synthetase-like protein